MAADASKYRKLINELVRLPGESEWLEFKENNSDPEEIGEYISAISNSATLHGKAFGYLVWGVRDSDHELVGTTFDPHSQRIKGQELENWLATQLSPGVPFRFRKVELDGRSFVILEIPATLHTPVRFKDWESIRVGSYKKRLRDHPELERRLWSLLDRASFEDGVALTDIPAERVLEVLDYPSYFRLLGHPQLGSPESILDRLLSDRLAVSCAGGLFGVTNVGAILFARTLADFGRLGRKALRVVIYRGENRIETIKEQSIAEGYAAGFEGAIRYINDQLPQREYIGQALRNVVHGYPELAVRELVANALIHQDFSIGGAGPTVEIFSDRVEFTNPGKPLIDVLRFIDEPPRSRNETLASLMRRANICEERGSGIDKVIATIERSHLPAPDFRVTEGSTVAVLLGSRDFAHMDKEDRIRACFHHAAFQYVSGKRLTNASLRERLGLKDQNYTIASRIISDTKAAGLIKPYTRGSESKKDASYIPFWV